RNSVVPLSHAAARRAARQHRVHHGQRRQESRIQVGSSEATLGVYMAKLGRAAAFTGQDGQPYSVGIFIEEQPDERGRYGASLLFVRWSPAGDRAVGHVEPEVLAWGRNASEAEERIKALSLYDVKSALDEAIARGPVAW